MARRIVKIIFSKYFKFAFVLLFAFVWITFFDDYSFLEQKKHKQELASLQTELTQTRKKISNYMAYSSLLKENLDEQELIGRNTYYMKRDDEDVFIFLKTENGKLVPLED